MKAISLWQPWATLLACGEKQIETRSWRIPYRGPLLIHAGKRWNAELENLCATEPFRSTLRRCPEMAWGALLGTVHLVDCLPIASSKKLPVGICCAGLDEGIVRIWEPKNLPGVSTHVGFTQGNEKEAVFGDYSPGRWAWVCKRPSPFANPIPWRGSPGLFDVADDAVRHLLEFVP